MVLAAEIAFIALALCPLVAWPGMGEDHLRAVWVLLAAGVIVWRVAHAVARRRERSPQVHPLMLAAAAFLILRFISLFFAVNVWEGVVPLLVTAAGVAVCGALCHGAFSRAFLLRRGLYAFAAAGVAIGVYALLQKAGFDPLWGADKIVSTLGSTIRAGAVAAMIAPVCLALLFAAPGPGRRFLAAAGLAGSAALVFLSDSRGAWLAAAAGIALTILVLLARRDLPGRRFVGGIAALLLAVSVAFSAWQFDRVRSIFSADHPTNRVRLAMWSGTLKLSADNPVLGCGTGNFRMAFPPYRGADEFFVHFTDRRRYVSTEHAHNVCLQIAAENGCPALLFFLWVFYIAARMGRYRIRKAEEPESAAAVAGLMGGLLAFAVASLAAGLDRYVAPWTLFWLMLGAAEGAAVDRSKRRLRPAGEMAVVVRMLAGIVAVFAVYLCATRAVGHAHYYAAMRESDAEKRLEKLLRSAEINPSDWQAQYQIGYAYRVMQKYSDAQIHLERALRLHPNSVQALVSLGNVRKFRGRTEEALEYYGRAIELAPFYYAPYYNRTDILQKQGKTEEAKRDARTILEIAVRHRDEFRRSGLADRNGLAAYVCAKAVEVDPSLKDDPRAREILGE